MPVFSSYEPLTGMEIHGPDIVLDEALGLPPAVKKLYPFKSRFLNLDGRYIHYIDEGEGEPILFVHGNPTWSFFYRNLVLGLRDKFRCIAVDHLGCGYSDRPWGWRWDLQGHIDHLCALIRRLRLKSFNLVVHDWGGPIGLAAALNFPEKIRRITLLNTGAFCPNYGEVPLRILLMRTQGLGHLLVMGMNAFVLGALYCTTVKTMPPEVKWAYRFPYTGITWRQRLGVMSFLRDIPCHKGHPSWPLLKSIEENLPFLQRVPVQICWGEKDFCFSPYWRERWQDTLPHAEVHRFENAGHYILEDAWPEVLEKMGEFMSRPMPSWAAGTWPKELHPELAPQTGSLPN